MDNEPTKEELKEIEERIKKQSGLTDEEWEYQQRENEKTMVQATKQKCNELLQEDGINNPTQKQIEEYMEYARDYIGCNSSVEVISLSEDNNA